MKEDCARAILRLIAVVTILIGGSMIAATLVSWLGATITMPGSFSSAGVLVYTVLHWGAIAACGGALYSLSPNLARKVVA
jgi:hypothetical protein